MASNEQHRPNPFTEFYGMFHFQGILPFSTLTDDE
jgi:hypothetical protein